MAQSPSMPNLPTPNTAKAGGVKLALIALLALALLGGAIYWLTRDDDTKEALKGKVLGTVDESLKDTPLAGVTKLLTPPPPPPPPSVTTPSTKPGTLAGQVIQGTVPTGVDGTGNATAAATTGTEPPALPKVEEDTAVRMLFVEDLAQWLVARYHPVKGPTWGISGLNLRYGGQMPGLNTQGGDKVAGRAWLLRYAFNPAMLSALYNLYADRFVEELTKAAANPQRGQALSPEQTDGMLNAYAGRFSAIGGALQGIASITDFPARMAGIAKVANQSLGIHSQIAEAVFALDEAREARNATKMETAQLRINGLNAQYQKINNDRNMAQQALVSAIRQGGPAARGLDDDTIMYIASWVERRGAQADTAQTVLTAANVLDNMAGRLRKAASIAR